MIHRPCPVLALVLMFVTMTVPGCTGTTVRPGCVAATERIATTSGGEAGSDAAPGIPADSVTRLTSGQPGPVLFVIAGLHGDEASGPEAARLLAAGPVPARGIIVVLPVASPEAMAPGERWAPRWSDLNRAFPVASPDNTVRGDLTDPTYKRADAILRLISAERPALVLDLHESDRYWTEGEMPVLVVPASAQSTELALALLETPGMEGFAFTGPPPAGSLAAAVDAVLGIPALIVEIPDKLELEERVRLHGVVTTTALRILGMLEEPNKQGNTPASQDPDS